MKTIALTDEQVKSIEDRSKERDNAIIGFEIALCTIGKIEREYCDSIRNDFPEIGEGSHFKLDLPNKVIIIK